MCAKQEMIKYNIPDVPFAELLEALGDLEYRLASATSDKVQLGSLVGIFVHARKQINNA